jgi:hypothetical protein
MMNPGLDVEDVYSQLDINCDGEVNFDEFVEALSNSY